MHFAAAGDAIRLASAVFPCENAPDGVLVQGKALHFAAATRAEFDCKSRGRAFWIRDTSVSFSDVHVRRGLADQAGAILIECRTGCNNLNISISDSSFVNNTMPSSRFCSGAGALTVILADQNWLNRIVIKNTVFSRNMARESTELPRVTTPLVLSGALAVFMVSSDRVAAAANSDNFMLLDSVRFLNNSAQCFGSLSGAFESTSCIGAAAFNVSSFSSDSNNRNRWSFVRVDALSNSVLFAGGCSEGRFAGGFLLLLACVAKQGIGSSGNAFLLLQSNCSNNFVQGRDYSQFRKSMAQSAGACILVQFLSAISAGADTRRNFLSLTRSRLHGNRLDKLTLGISRISGLLAHGIGCLTTDALTVNVSACNFSFNGVGTSSGKSAVLHLNGISTPLLEVPIPSLQLNFLQSGFMSNRADMVITAWGDRGTIAFLDSSLRNNTSSTAVLSITAQNTVVTISRGTFVDNRYSGSTGVVDIRGSFQNDPKSLVEHSVFRGNFGTSLFLGVSENYAIYNCSFATNRGAAVNIRLPADGTPRRTLAIRNTRFLFNAGAVTIGSIDAITGMAVSVVDCQFDGNRGINIGALKISGNATLSITGCRFRNNEAVTSSTIISNGGAVSMQRGRIVVRSSEFISNRASLGGALYLDYVQFQGQGLYFVNNSASAPGQTAYVIGGDFSMISSNALMPLEAISFVLASSRLHISNNRFACSVGGRPEVINSSIICSLCPAGTYLLDAGYWDGQSSKSECQECPFGAVCSGGSDIKIVSDYWAARLGSRLFVSPCPHDRCCIGADACSISSICRSTSLC